MTKVYCIILASKDGELPLVSKMCIGDTDAFSFAQSQAIEHVKHVFQGEIDQEEQIERIQNCKDLERCGILDDLALLSIAFSNAMREANKRNLENYFSCELTIKYAEVH
jgi:hypothetical protein